MGKIAGVVAAVASVASSIGPLIGSFGSLLGGGGGGGGGGYQVPPPPAPQVVEAPPPPPEEATLEPEGVLDQESAKARALRRKQQRDQKSPTSLFSESENTTIPTLLGD